MTMKRKMNNNTNTLIKFWIIVTLLLISTTPVPAAAWVIRQHNSNNKRSSLPTTTATAAATRTATQTAARVVLFAEQQQQQQEGSTTAEQQQAAAAAAGVGNSSGNTIITLDGTEIRKPLAALNNILIVKVRDTLTATSGGVLLPDQARQRPTEGTVVAAGPGKLHPDTGVRIASPIVEGMSVVYGQFDGKPVEYMGDECQIIRDDDVLLSYDSGVTMRLDNVTPVRDYVLIRLDKTDLQPVTSSGVVIAATVLSKDRVPCLGTVTKVGEGRMASSGVLTPPPVKVGDVVKFKEYAGNEVVIEGEPYAVVKMVDILCTFTADEKEEGEA